jgi:biopolymer transport protein ExbB/TolQ
MPNYMYRLSSKAGILLTSWIVAYGMWAVPHALAQEASDTTAASADTGLGSGDGFLLWDLIGDAGGFQYPIFGLLAIGLFLISAKVYELYKDRKAARELEEASLEDMDMNRITMLVANQKKSMLADLQATMLNVFKTTKDAATLHEEIANFIQFQRDRFSTFKQRIDFLADTAGAVGLLGTVWGILRVFTGGGIDDEQRVLAGMGIALVSTLLGLVVSITLNLISTEVYSFFDDRLDQIEDKADELRFRLLELGLSENGAEESSSQSDSRSQPEVLSQSTAETQQVESSRSTASKATGRAADRPGSSSSTGTRVDTQTEKPTQDGSPSTTTVEPTPDQLEIQSQPGTATVGATLNDIRLKLTGENGNPIAEEPVRLQVGDESGALADGQTEITRRTDEEGIATFDWHLPDAAGPCDVNADVPSSNAAGAKAQLSVMARPGSPTQYEQSGNNQGAEMGNALPRPLSVKLFDAYGNPVPGQSVEFYVDSGGGIFENGEKSIEAQTDDQGKAAVEFWVGEEPGLNSITAHMGGEKVKFQAMTLEQ